LLGVAQHAASERIVLGTAKQFDRRDARIAQAFERFSPASRSAGGKR
jgi:hypothetical protein